MLGQAPDPDAAARGAFEAGRESYDRGNFSEALGLFEFSYRTSPRPQLLFNIGRAADEAGQDARAIDAYTRYLGANADASNRGFVEARLRKLRNASHARAAPPSVPPSPAPPIVPRSPAPYPATYVAQGPRTRKFQLYGGVSLGVAGTVATDIDLQPSFGLQVGAGWVWRLFGLGAELRWSRYNGGAEYYGGHYDVSGGMIRALLKPRLGYQFKSIPVQLYGALPHGLTVLYDTQRYPVFRGSTVFEVSVGLVGGASYFVTDAFGINLEFGYDGQALLDTPRYREWTLFRLNAVLRI